MNAKDTVSFDRKAPRTGIDETGRPTSASVSGFPRDVKGNFQERAKRSKIKAQGAEVEIEADFYSHEFTTGEIGDTLTFAGRVLYVAATSRRSGPGGEVRFVKYLLTATVMGVDQPSP